jgi:hypothetical protein
MREESAMKECPPERSQIAREILAYLSGRPDAEDTLEGIMRHRLPDRPTGQQETLLKEVIADLATQGRIEKVQKDDRTLYRVQSRR